MTADLDLEQHGPWRHLQGRGEFLGNHDQAQVFHATFLRSDRPHARVVSVDTSRAEQLPGVLGVLTGDDVVAMSTPILESKVLRMGPGVVDVGVVDHRLPDFHALSDAEVHYVGDPMCLVVASSRAVAEDAVQLIDVIYEPLDAVATMGDALRGDTVAFEGWPDNVGFEFRRSSGEVDAAFARAHSVICETFSMHRAGYLPLEPMIVRAAPEARGGVTVHLTTQRVHVARTAIADVLRMPESLVRVIAPRDIGGAFGSKAAFYRETFAVVLASVQFGVPVMWRQDRLEALLSGGHERDGLTEIVGAFDDTGRLLAQRVRLWQDVGCAKVDQYSYAGPFASALSSSPYALEGYEIEARGIVTNKCPAVVNRTAGKMPLVFAMERFMDRAAHRLGLSGVDLRMRNLPTSHPWNAPTGARLEGDFRGAFETLLDRMSHAELTAWAESERLAGRAVGIGTSLTVDIASPRPSALGARGYGQPFYASARIKMEIDGQVVVFTGDSPQGQDRESRFAQIVADELGLSARDVRVVLGDTAVTPFTNHGSHTHSAVFLAARDLKERLLLIGSHLVGSEVESCRLLDGGVVSNDGARASFGDIGVAAYLKPHLLPPGTGPFLEFTRVHESQGSTNGFSAHACLVHVLPEGRVRVLKWWLVADAGRVLETGTFNGALRGAIEAGLGNTFYEHYAYGPDAQPEFLDVRSVLMPRALDMPEIDIAHHLHPTDLSLLGFKKGVTEGGAAGVPPAVVAAVEDALGGPEKVKITDLPVTPQRLWAHLFALPQDAVGLSAHREEPPS